MEIVCHMVRYLVQIIFSYACILFGPEPQFCRLACGTDETVAKSKGSDIKGLFFVLIICIVAKIKFGLLWVHDGGSYGEYDNLHQVPCVFLMKKNILYIITQ